MSVQSRSGSATGTTSHVLPGSQTKKTNKEAAALDDAVDLGALSFDDLTERSQQYHQNQQDVLEEEAEELKTMTRKERRALAKASQKRNTKLQDDPLLNRIRPKEGYMFRSDYFKVDQGYATILSYFHDEGAHDAFGAFWGINRITSGLDERVSVLNFEQVERMGKKWIDDHSKTSERLDKMEESDQDAGQSTRKSRRRQEKVSEDMDVINDELANGASYLHVHNRMMVKAPSLSVLEDSIQKISQLYIDRFGTLRVEAYHGEQRQELSKLFQPNSAKRGKGFHFTSPEFAGSYSLVTNGVNDLTGEYVGYMVGDVNNSAALVDMNDFRRRVVIADDSQSEVLNHAFVSDMWGSKISQSALLSNNRVVHIVLNDANLDDVGPELSSLTARLDMSSGDINMLELFGEKKDELSIFPAHLQKIVLMAEQAYQTSDTDRSIIRGSLESTLTEFYTDKNMWELDAKHHRDRLRLVGLPHDQVPRLQDLVTYFETKYTALKNSTARDDAQMRAYNVLHMVFKNMLDNNGDLFNTETSDSVDSVRDARRVIYNFAELQRRGQGIAMAQLVNVIGFAVDALERGDVIIFHGAELIARTMKEDDYGVKEYINTQLNHLFRRGGRAVYLYNDIEHMLNDDKFNRLDKSDYTILGTMTENTVKQYQKKLGQDIPASLESLITTRDAEFSYFRREHVNVVFQRDISLGFLAGREQRRAELAEIVPDTAAEVMQKGQKVSQDDSSAVVSDIESLSSGDDEKPQRQAGPSRRRALRQRPAQMTQERTQTTQRRRARRLGDTTSQ